MSFPDLETLLWARKKYGSNGSSGGVKVFLITETESYPQYAFMDSFLYKLSDDAPTMDELQEAHAYGLQKASDSGYFWYRPDVGVAHEDPDVPGFIHIAANFLSITKEGSASLESFGVEILPGLYATSAVSMGDCLIYGATQ